jgi:hypothetical protein
MQECSAVAKSKLRFTENEIWRAIRAFRKSGLPVGRVEVDPASGCIVVIAAGEAIPDNGKQTSVQAEG